MNLWVSLYEGSFFAQLNADRLANTGGRVSVNIRRTICRCYKEVSSNRHVATRHSSVIQSKVCVCVKTRNIYRLFLLKQDKRRKVNETVVTTPWHVHSWASSISWQQVSMTTALNYYFRKNWIYLNCVSREIFRSGAFTCLLLIAWSSPASTGFTFHILRRQEGLCSPYFRLSSLSHQVRETPGRFS
jgi:hypothetical protein